MRVAKTSINLEWKSFSVDINVIDSWAISNCGPNYCCPQAHKVLELWFTEEPSQEIKDAVQTYWDSLTEESDEALSYKSRVDREAEAKITKDTLVASATSKLEALGLSPEEIQALRG